MDFIIFRHMHCKNQGKYANDVAKKGHFASVQCFCVKSFFIYMARVTQSAFASRTASSTLSKIFKKGITPQNYSIESGCDCMLMMALKCEPELS